MATLIESTVAVARDPGRLLPTSGLGVAPE